MKNGLGNLSAADIDQLTAIIKNRLKSIQYRPALIGAFLAQTGLTLEPEPPWPPQPFNFCSGHEKYGVRSVSSRLAAIRIPVPRSSAV